jgi:hypothetical protein
MRSLGLLDCLASTVLKAQWIAARAVALLDDLTTAERSAPRRLGRERLLDLLHAPATKRDDE